MSARGDATSMTFRPEAHMQFTRDKGTVLERMLSGTQHKPFIDYMRKELLHCLHLSAANFIYDFAGDCEAYANHLLTADEHLPGRAPMRGLAAQSRLLRWNEEAKRIAREEQPIPGAPDASKELAKPISMESFICGPDWEKLGARIDRKPDGTLDIYTVKTDGYSATTAFEMDDLDFETHWHWLELTCRVVHGVPNITVSRFWQNDKNEQERLAIFQKNLYPSSVPQTLYVPLKPGTGMTAIIIGNSQIMTLEREKTSQSQIAILSAAVIKTGKN
jgi:hypothetical protein